MPPKASTSARPQHVRKPSVAKTGTFDAAANKEKGKQQPKDKDKDAGAMLPPPAPPKPQAILEPEIGALEDSLKNTTVMTGQIFRFYADAKRLDIQRHAPRPPRSMTTALAYELGRYDQICDALESHLARAIAVLQRDLTQEENRVREEEAEKARAKAAQPVSTDTDVEMTNAAGSSSETGAKTRQSTPSGMTSGTGKPPLRRASKISLSSLHRNPFPLKLDLSSTSLRLSGDETNLNMAALGNLNALGGMNSLGSMGVGGIPGLSSPITLAPKSARPVAPGEFPPEILAVIAAAGAANQNSLNQNRQVDIDLTLDENLGAPPNIEMLGGALGNSADKPIELDLDLEVRMSDLASVFGERESGGTRDQEQKSNTHVNVDDLFSPISSHGPDLPAANASAESMDMSILNALSATPNQTDALFASLDTADAGQENASVSQQDSVTVKAGSNPTDDPASFDYGQLEMGDMFFNESSNQEDMDDMMAQFMNIDSTDGTAKTGASGSGIVEAPDSAPTS